MDRLNTTFRLPTAMMASTLRKPLGNVSGTDARQPFQNADPKPVSETVAPISGGAATAKPMYAVAAGVSLNQSDFDLIAKTTGVTMRDRHFYDSKDAEITDMGSHQDALELYTLLTDMRSLKFGKGGAAITSQDINTYLGDNKMSGWSAYNAVLQQAKGSTPA